MPDADLFAQTELSARGLDSRAYYDTEIMQKMKSQILSETIKYWRGFGMSGISPFAELFYLYRTQSDPRDWYDAKEYKAEQSDFRTSGVHPDSIKMPYLAEFDPESPSTPATPSKARSNPSRRSLAARRANLSTSQRTSLRAKMCRGLRP